MLSNLPFFPPLVNPASGSGSGSGSAAALLPCETGSGIQAKGSSDTFPQEATSHPLSSSRTRSPRSAAKQSQRLKYDKPARRSGRSKSRSRSRHASASSSSWVGESTTSGTSTTAPHDSSWRWCVPCPPGTSAVKRNQYSFYAGFAPPEVTSPWAISVPDPSVWVTDACPILGNDNLPSPTLALTTSSLRHNVTIARPWTSSTSTKQSGTAAGADPNASILSTAAVTPSPPSRHPSISLPHTPAYSIASTASGSDLFVTGRAQIYRVPVASILSSSSSSPSVPPIPVLPTNMIYPPFARLTDICLDSSKLHTNVYAPSLLQADAWDLAAGQRVWTVPRVAGYARQARAGGEFPNTLALLPIVPSSSSSFMPHPPSGGPGTAIRIWDARTNYTPVGGTLAFGLTQHDRVALVHWSPTSVHTLYSAGSHVAKWDVRFAASPVARSESTHSSDVTNMFIVTESVTDGAALVATAGREGEVHVQYLCESVTDGMPATAVTVGVLPGAASGSLAYLGRGDAAVTVGASVRFMSVPANGGMAKCVQVPESTCRYLKLASAGSEGALSDGAGGPPSLLQSSAGSRRWATAESAKVLDASVFELTESVVTRAMRSRTGSAAGESGLRSRGSTGGLPSSVQASLPYSREEETPAAAVEAANMAKAKRRKKRSPSWSRARSRTRSRTTSNKNNNVDEVPTPSAPAVSTETPPETPSSPPAISISDLPTSIAHALATSDADLAHSLVPLLLLALDLDAIQVPAVHTLRNFVLLLLKSNYVAGLEFGVRLVEWWMAMRERQREQEQAPKTGGGLIRRLSLTRLSKRAASPDAGEQDRVRKAAEQRDREADEWACLVHYLLLPTVYDTDPTLDEERRKVVARLKVAEDAAAAAAGPVAAVGDTSIMSLPAHVLHTKPVPPSPGRSSAGGGIVGHLRRRASFGSGNSRSVKRPHIPAALGTATTDSAVHLEAPPSPATSCASLYTWQTTEDAYKDLVARKQRAQQALSGVLTNPSLVLPMLRSALHIQLALTSTSTKNDAHLVLIDLVRTSPRTISTTVLRSYLHALAYTSLSPPGTQPLWDEYMYAASEMAATYAGFDFSEALARHVRLRIVPRILDWCARVRARIMASRKVSGDLIDPRTYRIAGDVAADSCVVVAARLARYLHARVGAPLAEEVNWVRREVGEVAREVLEAVARVGRYAAQAGGGAGEAELVLVRKAVFEVMTKVKMEVPRYVQAASGEKSAGVGKRGKVKMADPEMYAGLVEKMQDMLFGSA